MPDLLTHFSLAYLITKPFRIRRSYFPFILGAVLPDIFTRIPMLFTSWEKDWFFIPIHTPIPIILLCLLLGFFFEEEKRELVFLGLVTGSFFHIFLDILQKNVVSYYFLFFPFSWKAPQVGLFWGEESMLTIPFILIFLIGVDWVSTTIKGRGEKFNDSV